jgi:DNA-binding transcriptional regulator YiaG
MMVGELSKRLVKDLAEWCAEERGRKAEACRALGVSHQTMANWFAHRQNLTGEQALMLLKFLKKHRRGRIREAVSAELSWV